MGIALQEVSFPIFGEKFKLRPCSYLAPDSKIANFEKLASSPAPTSDLTRTNYILNFRHYMGIVRQEVCFPIFGEEFKLRRC